MTDLEHRLLALATEWEQEAEEPAPHEMSNALLLQTVATELRDTVLHEPEETTVPRHEPIDTWLLAAPHRMVTLTVDSTGRIAARLDEGMLERGTGHGAIAAEAMANALNDVMGKQYK
jgi:hypothetical protein